MTKRNKILKLVEEPVEHLPYRTPVLSLRLYINDEDLQSAITLNYNHIKNQLTAFDSLTQWPLFSIDLIPTSDIPLGQITKQRIDYLFGHEVKNERLVNRLIAGLTEFNEVVAGAANQDDVFLMLRNYYKFKTTIIPRSKRWDTTFRIGMNGFYSALFYNPTKPEKKNTGGREAKFSINIGTNFSIVFYHDFFKPYPMLYIVDRNTKEAYTAHLGITGFMRRHLIKSERPITTELRDAVLNGAGVNKINGIFSRMVGSDLK
jgi:hypothetical protein